MKAGFLEDEDFANFAGWRSFPGKFNMLQADDFPDVAALKRIQTKTRIDQSLLQVPSAHTYFMRFSSDGTSFFCPEQKGGWRGEERPKNRCDRRRRKTVWRRDELMMLKRLKIEAENRCERFEKNGCTT